MKQDSKHEDGGPPEGRYANYFEIGHNAFEFLMDFGQLYPENKKISFHTRIITNPFYAKALLMTLQKAITQYENTYDDIPGEEAQQKNGEMNGD